MLNEQNKIRVGLCETQPATAEGIRSLLGGTSDLECRWCAGSLAMALAMQGQQPVDVLLVEKTCLLTPNRELADFLESPGGGPGLVVWSHALSEAEALRYAQAGARGVLRKSSELATILRCLRVVGSGASWMETGPAEEPERSERGARSNLTSRERQVLELVEQGLRNKDIAGKLGIQPGTVKIHMKHIFEKTGVRGRYGLALNGLRQKGLLALARASEAPEKGMEFVELLEARALKAS